MTEQIKNGDYVKSGDSLTELEYVDELLQSLTLLLKMPRKKYYPDKNFGSLLYSIQDTDINDKILAYARYATNDINSVFIKSVTVNGKEKIFTVIINDEERQVSVTL